ncbi:MAG: HupE/UreJ family protein [Verrucomicrobiae bacterium]
MNAPSIKRNALLTLSLLLIPTLAHAHVGIGETSGFLHGMGHPLTGIDHICAMVAVGLWASQMGGRSLWLVPLTFLLVMATGGLLGMSGITLPFVEQGIIVSVLTLGVFIAAAIRLPLVASVALVGLFALCHGHAHGSEMPSSVSGLQFAMGFVLATTIFHTLGIGLGVAMQKQGRPMVVRFAGLAIIYCGACL